MSTSPTQSDTPDISELVAYLDGELTADECRRVERRLASDADYRQKLTELEQAWTALESLPTTKVDDDFARTTIEMVTVAAVREAKAQSTSQAVIGRRRKYWMAAGGLAIAMASFAAARVLVPSRDNALVADLPVIEQLDVLTEISDVEYLRGLARLDFAGSTRGTSSATTTTTTTTSAATASDWQSFDDRADWIESLPAKEKADLSAKFERFEKLMPRPEAQDRLRSLERDVATASDRDQLEATLAAYGEWLQSRTQGEKLKLRERDISTAERLERAKSLLAETQLAARRQLSLEDEKALQDAILSIVEERRGELVQEIGRQGNPDPERRLGGQPAARVAMVIIGGDLRNEERRGRTIDRLSAHLSPDAQEYLNGLDRGQRGWQLMRWVYEAVGSNVGRQNLEQFFASGLTDDQREILLGLPLSEMNEQLEQMYMRSQVGLREDDSLRRLWRGGFDGRGPQDRGRGGDDRGRRDGRRREMDGERFDGPPPGPPGPGGPGRGGPGRGGPGGRPPGPPPPRDGRDWRPPPEGGPRDGGPRPEDRREEPI